MMFKEKEFKVAVVEDEYEVRQELVQGINECEQFKVVFQTDSLSGAVEYLSVNRPDVVFLDIKLNGGNAFQLLEILQNSGNELPAIVICTGFRDFEVAKSLVNKYGDQIIYILNKPFWENWDTHKGSIQDAIYLRIKRKYKPPVSTDSILAVKSDQVTYFCKLTQLILVRTHEKSNGRLEFISTDSHIISYNSLLRIIDKLPSNFLQINRYCIINLLHVKNISRADWSIEMSNSEILSISATYLDDFKKSLQDLGQYNALIMI